MNPNINLQYLKFFSCWTFSELLNRNSSFVSDDEQSGCDFWKEVFWFRLELEFSNGVSCYLDCLDVNLVLLSILWLFQLVLLDKLCTAFSAFRSSGCFCRHCIASIGNRFFFRFCASVHSIVMIEGFCFEYHR